ncbi:MAG: HEPN domain-containing protein, partial [Candidatus Bathycorpusculaceae bacterium]
YPVTLYKGWNLISLPLIPANSSTTAVLSLILKQGIAGVTVVYEYDQYFDSGCGLPSYGHSLSRLLTSVEEDLGSIEHEIVEAAKTLDKYYIPTRYPNAWVEGSPEEYYTKMDAEAAIKSAEQIISWVEERWKLLKKRRS